MDRGSPIQIFASIHDPRSILFWIADLDRRSKKWIADPKWIAVPSIGDPVPSLRKRDLVISLAERLAMPKYLLVGSVRDRRYNFKKLGFLRKENKRRHIL